VWDAVTCAVEIQRGMVGRNAEISPDKRMEFRIGINVGDVIADGDDIFGGGINVAARLEASPIAAAQLGNVGLAAQTVQNYPDLLFGQMTLVDCPADVLHDPLKWQFRVHGAVKSVSQVLMPDNDSWRFKSRADDHPTTRARAVATTPTSSDGASATAKTRRSIGGKRRTDSQSEDLKLHPTQLRSWVKAFADDPQHALPDQG